ncbi:MAG TPA: DUF309 domain-containing protein [Candidatus Paenibacillus intestinavium]|nr:DUF309 domain-containing protein [Candidatus Paenibacillus intestinavium]
MVYPKEYINYLIEFHATRDYFECHELLEEYWKEHPNDGNEAFWVGCIQVAVGQYHERRNNLRGARLMYESAIEKFTMLPQVVKGIDVHNITVQLQQHVQACQLQLPYNDMKFIIVDPQLGELCEQEVALRNLRWDISSKEVSEEIIHRHKLRDRSDVIAARQEALRKKSIERDFTKEE